MNTHTCPLGDVLLARTLDRPRRPHPARVGAETEKLLHEGAAVALLSDMIDWWTQASGSGIDSYRAAVEQGRFDHLPTAREAVMAGLEGEEAMIPHLDAVYEEYVLAYFGMLSLAVAES